MRPALLIILCSIITGCSRPQRMELWYWHHSYITTPEAVRSSKALIDRAAHAGYTGAVLWDSSLLFLSFPNWPARNEEYLREVIRYAADRGLRVMPLAAPYGHSGDVLRLNPNWAEGQRVEGARFRVDGAGKRLVQVKEVEQKVDASPRSAFSLRLPVTPWRQYHVRFSVRTRGFQGLAQIEVSDGKDSRLDARLHIAPDQDWTQSDYVFNSGGSAGVRITAGAFGAHAGELLVRDFFVEETALVFLIRRAGAPMRLYDASQEYAEGRDFDTIHDPKLPDFDNGFHTPPEMTIPPGSRLRAGDYVTIDYYAVTPIEYLGVGLCLTDPDAHRWVIENARKLAALGSGVLLGHDEMRQLNSCASCRAKRMSAGDLLAWSFENTARELRGPLYVWSDMFDPYHNARNHIGYVEGDVAGSWRGIPREVAVMNWNLEHLRASLTWFSGDDPRQAVAHRQIIAGYYDPPDHDGARSARQEFEQATGIPGIAGMMYTTWADDYSQLESFAQGAREGWNRYRASAPK